MCGITGYYATKALEDDARRASLAAIRHRGPDDDGQFTAGPVWLGMRRLSIIDVAGGHQPIANEDDTIHVVFNGEIYNYRELAEDLRPRHTLRTHSDTETLVHLYEEHGDRLCERLRGMFAFAIWDAKARRLLLARDRFGKKPLYYFHRPGKGLVFASELKALRPLLDALGESPAVRPQAISDYLSLGCVPQPETVYEGVHALPPGCTLSYDGTEPRITRYWSPDARYRRVISYDEAVDRVRELVAESVRLRLRTDVPLGVFLSGGVDSSVVAYEASRHVGPSLRTFTIGTGDAALDESAVAARTARALGVRNDVLHLQVAPRDELEHLVRVYDQPFADSSAIPSLAVSRMAREHVKVILNGDGGDEVFAGYRRYLAAWASEALDPIGPLLGPALGGLQRLAQARRTSAGFAARLGRGLAVQGGARYLVWTADMLLEADKQGALRSSGLRSTESFIESLAPGASRGLRGQMRADQVVNLLSDLLVKMDMATSAASLEGRSPLLDHVLAEFVASLPSSYLLHRGQLKSLLRDAYRGRLPDEVIRGKKRGFEVPLERWLDGELREVLRDTVASPGALVRSYVDGQFLDRLLAREVLRERNWAYLVYALLVLELWLRQERRDHVDQRDTAGAAA